MLEGKKVLLSAWGTQGGADDVVSSLINGFRQRGIESDLLYHSPGFDKRQFTKPYIGRFLLSAFKLLKRYGYQRFIEQGSVRFMPGGSGEEQKFRWNQFIRNTNWQDYAVIDFHSCTFASTELDTLKEAASNIPLVAHVHGVNSHAALIEDKDKLLKEFPVSKLQTVPEHVKKQLRDKYNPLCSARYQENLLDAADKLTFLTRFTHDITSFWYPKLGDDDRVKFIPNGSDFHKHADDPSVERRATEIRHTIGNDAKIIMYSGRIVPPKGASDLAMAFDKIKEVHPDVKLLLSGRYDPTYKMPDSSNNDGSAAVYHYIRPEFHDDIIYMGWASNKKELAARLKAADVLALPSYHETFSIAALESMFMGTPVVLGDVDGSSEVYVKPQLAYGVTPGDIDEMVSHFNDIFNNPGRAQRDARVVKDTVNERYSLSSVINKTIGLYESAIQEKR